MFPDREAADVELDRIVTRNHARIVAIGRKRGLDWDSLNEDERAQLIDDILHEPDDAA